MGSFGGSLCGRWTSLAASMASISKNRLAKAEGTLVWHFPGSKEGLRKGERGTSVRSLPRLLPFPLPEGRIVWSFPPCLRLKGTPVGYYREQTKALLAVDFRADCMF